MRNAVVLFWPFSLYLGVWLGCSSQNAASPPATAGSGAPPLDDASIADALGSPAALPCNVDAILAAHCRTCHGASPAFGAPMPLVTYEDLHAPASSDASRKVYELVARRIHDDARPMPQPPNARLDGASLGTLDAWTGAGAPAASTQSAACAADAASGADSGAVPGLSCTPDVHMRPGAPWSMPQQAEDLYTCYGFDVTAAQKRHLVGIAPKIDNPGIIHHLLLYESPTAVSPTPGACDLGQLAAWRVVYGWAPGTQNLEFPPEAGYPIDKLTHYVVQIHYNNVKHLAGQTDASGFDFCTTDKLRPNDADALVFGTLSFTIPPHGSLDLTCAYTMPAGAPDLHAFAAFPHMHQLGKSIATTLVRGDAGAPVDLGARPTWDFNSQVYVPVSATLRAGDVVKTRCAWDNPHADPVAFGPFTSDEMCFSYTLYYPRVSAAGWRWEGPAESSVCTPTP